MRRLMIAALSSGSGKTVVSAALISAFRKRGIRTCAFKCGPDYIDTSFLSAAAGENAGNLDVFLQGEENVKDTLFRSNADLAVIEGVMGYYDGEAGGERASSYDIARITDTPVILIVRPKGMSLTLAACLKGVVDFRKDSRIKGVILTDCSEKYYLHIKDVIERSTGLSVYGHIPHDECAYVSSRHLGLDIEESDNAAERMIKLGKMAEAHIDLDALYDAASEGRDPGAHGIAHEGSGRGDRFAAVKDDLPGNKCTIAVAKDEAFCFYYRDNIDMLERYGARIVYFSPLKDKSLPDADGLYLGGGYPELYAGKLSENREMKTSIRNAAANKMPIVAECGGFMYLQETLEDRDKNAVSMVGVLPGNSVKCPGLRRFGYLTIKACEDSLLFRKGEEIPAHEFHYWDSDRNGSDLIAFKSDGRNWRFGYSNDCIYAGFPHLHFGGDVPMAQRFAAAASLYREKRSG